MKVVKTKTGPVVLAVVAMLLLVAVPVAQAWPFGDVPAGYWAYNAIRRVAYLNITSGCGGGNYCPEAYVTRAQMAGFLNNLSKAWTDQDEPYILSVDHRFLYNDRPAIVGKANGGTGVQGFSYGALNADNGVYGETNSRDNFEAGVHGYSTSYASGVIGISTGGWGALLQGASENTPDLVLGGTDGANDNGHIHSDPYLGSSDLLLYSNDEIQFHMDENNNEDGNLAIYDGNNQQELRIDEGGNWWGGWEAANYDNHLRVRDDFVIHLDQTADDLDWGTFAVQNADAPDYAFYVQEDGDTYVRGDFAVGGTKSAVEQTSEGPRKLYAMESPEVWFEDFGTGQLVDGQAMVNMEPLFLETVNTGVAYHVFLTPLGDCSGLYVADKAATSFKVRELGGGTANVAFDYRIVAKRRGYEAVRLEEPEIMDASLEAVPAVMEMDEAPIPGQPIVFERGEPEK